jgi:hypothetical protein
LWTIARSWLWTMILLISASWVVRITSMSHWRPALDGFERPGLKLLVWHAWGLSGTCQERLLPLLTLCPPTFKMCAMATLEVKWKETASAQGSLRAHSLVSSSCALPCCPSTEEVFITTIEPSPADLPRGGGTTLWGRQR